MIKGLGKILAVPVFLAVSLFFIASAGFTQAKQPCLFNGTIDNVKVKSFKCEIVHGAGPSYLLIQMNFRGSYWMMDLTGVTKNPGTSNMLLVLKRHDGKKFAESYTGKTTQNLQASPKFPTLLGFFKSAIPLKDATGKKVLVTGDFIWDTSRFTK